MVRHKNYSPAVECRNHLSEITAHFKYGLGSCSDVSASPMVFPLGTEPWHHSEGAYLASSVGGGADEGCVPLPQLRGGRDGLLRHGAGRSPAEIPGPHPCAGGGTEG